MEKITTAPTSELTEEVESVLSGLYTDYDRRDQSVLSSDIFRSKLAKAIQATEKRVRAEMIGEVKKLVEGKRKSGGMAHPKKCDIECLDKPHYTYNKALDDIISIIKEE